MKRIKLVFSFTCVLWVATQQNELKAQSNKGIYCVEFADVGFSEKEVDLLHKRNEEFNKPTKRGSVYFRDLDEYCYIKIVVDTTNNYGLWEVSGGGHRGSFYVIKSSHKLYFVRFISKSKYGQVDKDKTLHTLSVYFYKSKSLPDDLEKKIVDAIASFY